MTTRFDPDKLAELILYIAGRSRDDPRFGMTKLNKILYFSDFKAFGMLGQSITGATYVRFDRGPVPEEMLETLDQLQQAEDIGMTERHYFNYRQKVVHPQREAVLSEVISDAEVAIVDAVLAELSLLNATEVSALSHLEKGWQLAEDREVIPYETVYVSDRRPSPRVFSQWKQAVDDRRSEQSS